MGAVRGHCRVIETSQSVEQRKNTTRQKIEYRYDNRTNKG